MKYKNVFCIPFVNSIGGIESWLYNLAKKYYKTHDITILYSYGNADQIRRLSRYVRVIKYEKQEIECENLFLNINTDMCDKVKADNYIMVIHGDYKALGILPNINKKVNEFIAVSKTVADTFTELTGKPCKVCYNPLILEKPQKVLKLVSATRLTSEKGKWRMQKLAELLDNSGTPYVWLIFTNDNEAIKGKGIVYKRPEYNILPYIQEADYLVQLSDTESWGYSIHEALLLGTPIITTPIPILEELEITEEQSIVLPFDMKEIQLEKIFKGLPPFEYNIKKDKWSDFMANGKSTYKPRTKKTYKVQATEQYQLLQVVDAGLGRILEKGEKFTVSLERFETLTGNNPYGVAFVEEIKDENK